MQRKIIGFKQDEEGHWVALLECGHTRHLRHQPPWTRREWITHPAARAARLGSLLFCQRCQEEQTAQPLEPDETSRKIATRVKAACLKTIVQAYEEAKMSGLCQEGAWELALDALRSLDVEAVLKELTPPGQAPASGTANNPSGPSVAQNAGKKKNTQPE